MLNNILQMAKLDLSHKRVMIREDFNVPLSDGEITNDERIKRALPTIKMAVAAGAKVILLSHLGRPQEGEYNSEFSLKPVAEALSKDLGQNVTLIKDWLDGVEPAAGEVVLCENVRFNPGEKVNDQALAKKMASLCDVFVMDAFATAHRAQASTYGVAEFAPVACAGPLLVAELEALTRAFFNPKRPLAAIVGGSKVSTKIQVLESLLDKVDQLIVGGGIANTFLKAKGHDIGKSLYEPDWVEPAQQLIEKAQQKGVELPIPVDVVVAQEMSPSAQAAIKTLSQISAGDAVFDIGPRTISAYQQLLNKAATIIWNGPVGVFEIDSFSAGTRVIGETVAESSAFSIAGGGDTLAALAKFGLSKQISYISTGGGAFLEFVEGKPLPAVSILEQRYQQESHHA